MADDARLKALIIQGVLYRTDVLSALDDFPLNPFRSLGIDLIDDQNHREGPGLPSLLIQAFIGSLLRSPGGLAPFLKGSLWGLGLGAITVLVVMAPPSGNPINTLNKPDLTP